MVNAAGQGLPGAHKNLGISQDVWHPQWIVTILSPAIQCFAVQAGTFSRMQMSFKLR